MLPCVKQTSRRKAFGNIIVTVINDESFIIGGSVTGTIQLNAWTTIATISDSDYRPKSQIDGIMVESSGISRQARCRTDGSIQVFGTESITNPCISISG